LSSDRDEINSASYHLSTPSAYHQAEFDLYGRTMYVDSVLSQSLPVGLPSVVAPINIAVPLIYPLPTWEERRFAPVFYSLASERFMLAFNTFSISLCVLLLVLVLRNRQQAVIRASTVSFSLVVIFGGILMLTSSYFSTLVVNDAHCAAQVWLLTLGWTAMYSALFIKTFRVWRIFGVQQLSVVKMKDSKLLFALASFLLVDVLINTVWASTVGITSTQVTVDPYRPSYDYLKCAYSGGGAVAVVLHLIIKGGMLLFGVSLAWGTRKAPPMFNDSTVIAAALYNTFFVCSFILPIIAVQMGGRSTTFLIRSFAIMFLVLTTLGLLYVPKFLLLFGLGDVSKLRLAIIAVNAPTGHGTGGTMKVQDVPAPVKSPAIVRSTVQQPPSRSTTMQQSSRAHPLPPIAHGTSLERPARLSVGSSVISLGAFSGRAENAHLSVVATPHPAAIVLSVTDSGSVPAAIVAATDSAGVSFFTAPPLSPVAATHDSPSPITSPPSSLHVDYRPPRERVRGSLQARDSASSARIDWRTERAKDSRGHE
jgi:hypothetical protein